MRSAQWELFQKQHDDHSDHGESRSNQKHVVECAHQADPDRVKQRGERRRALRAKAEHLRAQGIGNLRTQQDLRIFELLQHRRRNNEPDVLRQNLLERWQKLIGQQAAEQRHTYGAAH